jgi:hypothetical protein
VQFEVLECLLRHQALFALLWPLGSGTTTNNVSRILSRVG